MLRAPRLFTPGPASDIYCRYRDDPDWLEVRRKIEAAWAEFYPFCGDPEHFLVEMKEHPLERLWELTLATAAVDARYRLERPKKREGSPDVRAVLPDDRVLWIEGGTIGPADGDKRLQSVDEPRNGYKLGDSRLVLSRYTSLLGDKLGQLKRFKNGVVADGDLFVIAISSCRIRDADIADLPGFPLIGQAVFPHGSIALRVPIQPEEYSGPPLRSETLLVHQQRIGIVKKTEKNIDIPTALFLSPEWADVSAVLYGKTVLSLRGMTIFDNFNAAHKLPERAFPFAEEHRLDWNTETSQGSLTKVVPSRPPRRWRSWRQLVTELPSFLRGRSRDYWWRLRIRLWMAFHSERTKSRTSARG